MSLEVLTIEDYAENVRTEILKKVDDITITISKVNENGKELTGIVMRENGANVGMAQYVDSAFVENYPAEYLASEFIRRYENEKMPSEVGTIDFGNYDKVKSMLRIMLVNTERNKNADYVLRSVEGFDGLSYLPYVSLENGEFSGLARVTNKMLKVWNVSADEVINQAKTNTIEDKFTCIGLFEHLCELSGLPASMPIGEPPLYIITNKDYKYGTVNAILHGNEIFKLLNNEDFYIIPCSVHEAICVPCKEIMTTENLENLKSMILTVNATELREEDFLSDNLFVYENGEFKTVA